MEYIHTLADGSTVKYTEDMIKNAISDRDYYQGRYQDFVSRLNQLRTEVYNFFKDRYDSGDSEITLTVDDANEMLIMIGAGSLKALFTVSGTIHFTITDIEAETEEEANDIVNNELTVEFNGEGELDNWSLDINDITQQ